MTIAKAAEKLPDQLLVRYFRNRTIEKVQQVKVDRKTRDVVVTLADETVERWKNLEGVGWVPDVGAAS